MASDTPTAPSDDVARLLLKGRLTVDQMHADLLVLEQYLSASRLLQKQLDALLKPHPSFHRGST